MPLPHRHHFFQRVFGHPSSPSSPRRLLRHGGEGVIGVDYERVPLSLATATRAGPQVPAQGVPGGALLHDPLQHLPDPAGHVDTGLRRAPVPQQLYVCSTETHNFTACTVFSSPAFLLTPNPHPNPHYIFIFNAWVRMLARNSSLKY